MSMSIVLQFAMACLVFAAGVIVGQDNPKVKVGLYIEDWKTGCQYIQNPNGGITPRVDADGVHFGCKGLQER